MQIAEHAQRVLVNTIGLITRTLPQSIAHTALASGLVTAPDPMSPDLRAAESASDGIRRLLEHATCLRLADQQERQYAGRRVEMWLRIRSRFSQGFQTHHRHYPWPSPAQFIFFSLSNLTEHIRILTIWTIRHTPQVRMVHIVRIMSLRPTISPSNIFVAPTTWRKS
ncbi:MAG: hypothetical protein DID90_2727553136 [Candidatus Nitrotoga sp. LAW]|nr:MAG: hypothetical protein DID90_2727553136 [Candidatus Nitrotoga sp. LAW]